MVFRVYCLASAWKVSLKEINTSGKIFQKSVQLIDFADAIDIVARTFVKMADMYIGLKAEAQRIGLVTNASKTKYMKERGSREDSAHLSPRFHRHQLELEVGG